MQKGRRSRPGCRLAGGDDGWRVFQVFFGDEEFTAADGPFKRLLAIRKWMYLATCVVVLERANGIDFARLSKIVQFLTVSESLAHPVIVTGFFYLAVTYVVLLIQVGSVYDWILEDRLKLRDDERHKLQRDRLAQARTELEAADRAVEAQEKSARPQVNHLPVLIRDREIAQQRFMRAETDLLQQAQRDPRRRLGFLMPEIAVDLLRAALPLLVIVIGLVAIFFPEWMISKQAKVADILQTAPPPRPPSR